MGIRAGVSILLVAASQLTTTTQAPFVGVKSLIVLTMKTSQSVPRCSNAMLNAAFFTDATSVAAYYAENSNGLMSLSGTVSGPYEINLNESPRVGGGAPSMDRPTCMRRAWADAADAAATAAGAKLATYHYKAYIEPPETKTLCEFGGDAELKGTRMWLRDDFCDSKHIMAYSLGENIGAPNGATPTDFWGDASTVMGGYVRPPDLSLWNSMVHFNAPQKIAMGWLPVANIQTVAAPGSFRLALLDGVSTELQTLKIKGANSGSAYYYVSYRRATGFSSDLRTEYVDKVSVTQWSGNSRTNMLASLDDGQSFTDSSGLKITQTSHDARHANVAVSFDK